jgi:hypothetical protein
VPEYEYGAPDLEDDRNFREFILADLGNGNDQKVFNFREDPTKVAARKAEAERIAAREGLLDKLESVGIDRLLDALRREEVEEDPAAQTEADVADSVSSLHVGGGWYEVRVNGELVDKVRGEQARDELVASLEPQVA